MTTPTLYAPFSFPTTSASQLFCPKQLNNDANNDLFMRLPEWPDLPRSLRGRIIHARHLRRMIDYAVLLLQIHQENVADAANHKTMARQHGKTDSHRLSHIKQAMSLNIAARNARKYAHLLFHAVGAASYV